MSEQSNIEAKLSSIKRSFVLDWPLCLFCNHKVFKRGQLAHIIPRSHSSLYYTRFELQTMKLNTGLAHPDCHTIWDDHKDQSIYLPRFRELMYITWLIDPDYYNKIIMSNPGFSKLLPLFTEKMDLNHHGELLILQ